jgi:hypothetical protein
MKITVVKKSATRVNTMSICPFIVDNPPDGGAKQQ